MRQEIAGLEAAIVAMLAEYPDLKDDEGLRLDMLEAETDLTAVLTRLVEMEQDANDNEDAVENRIAELGTRAARFAKRALVARGIIQRLMERADVRKVALPIATLSLTEKARRLIVTNEEALPPECMKIKTETLPDMQIIKAKWEKDGVLPAGVAWSNGGTTLVMRVK